MTSANFYSCLSRHASENPDKVIFSMAEGESISRSAFLAEVNHNALKLRKYFGGSMPEAPIFVTVERNISSLVGIFSVYAAGGWYVPIDAALPAERIASMIGAASPAALLLSEPSQAFAGCGLPLIELERSKPASVSPETPCDGSVPISAVSAPSPAASVSAFSDAETLDFDRDPAAPLFGIMTSGSTGIPKLVVKNEQGLWDFIVSYCRTFELSADERFGSQIPFYFDASTKDIFSTVYLGASSVILPQRVFSFPAYLIETLDREKISTFVCVPSVMATVSQYEVFAEVLPHSLRKVLFVGERMPIKHLNYWRNYLPDTLFVNLYGSTEVAGNSCYYIVDREFAPDDVLPIGHPFDTARLFLLDEKGRPAAEGEICVAGSGLALGYYNDPEKTAQVFRNEDLPDGSFSGRLCHSGDFGRINERGEYVCVARKDAQIKHIGHRVELGDIESTVSGLDGVYECCCLFSAADSRIILFFSAAEDISRQLHKTLKHTLPRYMVPEELRYMQELPHNRNGKIDRALLKQSI